MVSYTSDKLPVVVSVDDLAEEAVEKELEMVAQFFGAVAKGRLDKSFEIRAVFVTCTLK
ncbi:hypothetical protein LBMAG57_35800 [Verrucomicrobiota bacterium]|nr:hypothetical protein LBMAG57_35800 [Verrucomicrobiota bacterium]